MTMDAETLALFQAEAQALAESLEAGLLQLRDSPTDRGLIDRVFRDLHTLKGTGGMFGHMELASFLHDFETAFEAVRSGDRAATPDLIAVSLRAHDHVAGLLAGDPPSGGDAILADLSALLGGHAAPARGAWRLRFRLPADTLALGGRPELVLDELRALGATRVSACVAALPPPEEIAGDTLLLAWEAELPPNTPEDVIREVFLFHDGVELELDAHAPRAEGRSPARTPAPALAPSPPTTLPAADSAPARPARPSGPPPSAAAEGEASRPSALMRVSAERLDDMMDRVGELVIAEARLNEIAARSGDPALLAVAEDIQRLATGMRDTTMSIRMTPLSSITGRFKRLVHDLSQSLGRPIDLVLEGEETELDKTVVEQLADPLLHLVRNAADHGIEDAAAREEAGKPRRGRVTLSARYSGAEVLIALSDDGRGLDPARIRQKAMERGLLSPDAEPTEAELFQLIFEPGFSTAPQVTELSGRGVGMDVVKRTVTKLRGSIDVASRPGDGTRVTLRLPLTLAIIDGLLVEVAGERFTIPLAAVDEIVELPGDSLGRDGGAHFLDIRGRLVPYLRLRALFASPGEGGAFQKVVVVTAGDTRVGLVVDRIIGSTQTVIKQLSPLHASLSIFSGATILGDGSVALIVDVPNLVSQARGPSAEGWRLPELAA
jgi:two-component system chemotaxis sensor kinase CheA